MAKLNVLGAQRVKALIVILAEKKQEALRELDCPTRTEVNKMVDAEFEIDKKRIAFNKAIVTAQKLATELGDVTGNQLTVSTSNYSRNSSSAYSKRITELCNELITKPQDAVSKEYKAKEQMLWLCETLEEAKEIVGIQ